MNMQISRRDFIQQISCGALSIGVIATTGGCETLLQAIANRPVRESITTLRDTDPTLQTYRDAVNRMRSLPPSDERNWTNQMGIHLNHCPHGNWYFLPWHRAYLYYFEQICRELTGNEDFALPYWNWSVDREIPAAFWGSTNNPLFHANRNASSTTRAPDHVVGPSVLESILGETNFFLFASQQSTSQRQRAGSGRLEGTPHNGIHGFVGGDMGGFRSPLDPVFWSHHNMVDCLWADWNMERNNPNTNDPAWVRHTFSGNFVDRNGNQVDIDVPATLLMPLLSYRFGPSRKGESEPDFRVADARAMRQFLEEGADVRLDIIRQFELRRGIDVVVGQPVTLPIPIDPEAVQRVLRERSQERLLLTVGSVEPPPRSNDFYVRVFLGETDISVETPITDPHYAGSFAFFVDEDHEGHENMEFLVDATATLERLQELGELSEADEVAIQLLAVPFPDRTPEATTFNLEFLELALVRSIIERPN